MGVFFFQKKFGFKIIFSELKFMNKFYYDTDYYKELRSRMVELIRIKGISAENVLKAIQDIPKHLFVNEEYFD